MDMQGKVVVITGGATGIGFALAKRFGGDGAKIVIGEPRAETLEAACETLAGMGVDARWTVCDVSSLESVKALADFAWDAHGQCDVVINNAGIGSRERRVPDVSLEDAHRIMDVNFWGVWHGCRVFGQRMKDQGTPAWIYNTGSENSLFCATTAAAYIASKHAVLGLTETFREQVPDFIKVGLIIPGWVASDLNPDFNRHAMDTDAFAAIIYPQILAGERFVVSHAYNTVRIDERMDALRDAYAKHAPRYAGDDEYDVRILVKRLREQGQI